MHKITRILEVPHDENEELHLHLYLGEGIEEAIGEHANAIHRYLKSVSLLGKAI